MHSQDKDLSNKKVPSQHLKALCSRNLQKVRIIKYWLIVVEFNEKHITSEDIQIHFLFCISLIALSKIMTIGTIILINIVFFGENFMSFKYYALFHLLKLFLPESHWVSTAFVVLAILWEAFVSPLFQKNLYVHHFPSTDLFLLSYMAKGLGIISAIICILLFIPNFAAFMVLPPTSVFKWHDSENPPESMASLLLSPVVNSQFSPHLAYEWQLSHVTLSPLISKTPCPLVLLLPCSQACYLSWFFLIKMNSKIWNALVFGFLLSISIDFLGDSS